MQIYEVNTMHMINGTMPNGAPIVPNGADCACNGHSNGKAPAINQAAWVWIALAFMLGSLVTRK